MSICASGRGFYGILPTPKRFTISTLTGFNLQLIIKSIENICSAMGPFSQAIIKVSNVEINLKLRNLM